VSSVRVPSQPQPLSPLPLVPSYTHTRFITTTTPSPAAAATATKGGPTTSTTGGGGGPLGQLKLSDIEAAHSRLRAGKKTYRTPLVRHCLVALKHTVVIRSRSNL
jgi:hypothetical protein